MSSLPSIYLILNAKSYGAGGRSGTRSGLADQAFFASFFQRLEKMKAQPARRTNRACKSGYSQGGIQESEPLAVTTNKRYGAKLSERIATATIDQKTMVNSQPTYQRA